MELQVQKVQRPFNLVQSKPTIRSQYHPICPPPAQPDPNPHNPSPSIPHTPPCQTPLIFYPPFSITNFQMNSESSWKREHSLLEQDASNISILKKEISKQAEIDASVQLTIAQKIDTLKATATLLAKKLQNEKHKNGELQTIIRFMKGKMEKEKLQEATHRDDINFDSLGSLDGKYKKLEYDLSQTNSKVNRLAENVEQKRNKINQNRMERVIDSGIFRNIEKELIDSELKFKKLLIEKIKYQTEYDKLMKEYSGLKEKAENYYGGHKDHSKQKLNSDSPLPAGDPLPNPHRKFIELDPKNLPYRSPTLHNIDEQTENDSQKQIITIRKMLIETGLQNSEELLYYLQNIDAINEKSFNEMNIYADQSNEIEKYIADIEHSKRSNRVNFYAPKRELSKHETLYYQCRHIKEKTDQSHQEIEVAFHEITDLFNEPNFHRFLEEAGIQPIAIKPEEISNFDYITDTLKLLEAKMQEYIHHCNPIHEDKGVTSRAAGQERLEEYINRVRKLDECDKVMKKEDFQEEYRRIVKNSSQKSLVAKTVPKKKSLGMIRK